jgi:CRISPR-associated protein Cas1
MIDLHELPKLRDSLSYLYVEHAIIERSDAAVAVLRKDGNLHVPAAMLCVLILGPGTSVTHAAMRVLADNGVTVLWTGEEMTRFYAWGTGETRKSHHLLRQAELSSNLEKRTEVVLRMYHKRFNFQLESSLSLPQIRGHEGVRMREAYAQASQKYGVEWKGRVYDRQNWNAGDPINRALSAANALLNSLCHAAIVSGGYSPALGFIHTGKQLSFVYDVADLYKTEITIPAAFEMTAKYPGSPERYTRQACRERFRETRLLERILPDIDALLDAQELPPEFDQLDADPAMPTALWDALLDEEGWQGWQAGE